MAISTIGTDALASAAVTSAKLASGAPSRSQLPAGTVLQVVSTAKTDTFSTTNAPWTDITGLSVAITPTSSNNKVLVTLHVNYGNSGAYMAGLRVTRNGTAIAIGDAAGSRVQATLGNVQYNGQNNDRSSFGSMTFLDSPATTSSVTYQVQTRTDSATVTINKSGADADNSGVYRTISTITATEIAA